MQPILLISVALLLAAAQSDAASLVKDKSHHHNRLYCPAKSSPRVVCYYSTWAYGHTGLGTFLPSNIDPTLCTHLIYAFIGIGAEGEILLLDEEFDIAQNGIAKFVALKEKNSKLNLMVGVGGWNAGSANFSIVAANETLRATFANNSVAFLKKYGFNGLDMDWEYPNQRENSTAADKANFVLMVQALKDAFADKGYLLSAAVSATQEGIDLSYDVPSLNKIMDFFNLMTYDFHGTWDGVTGVNAPLYPQVTDASDTVLTVNVSVHAWIENGADPAKLNIGLANYGHAYTLANATNNGTGANITTAAYTSPYAGETSTWTYIEICSDQVNNTSAWNIVNYNNSYVYGVKNNLWMGYDNVDTIYAKAAFAKDMGLGGIMFWDLPGDDFQGYCGGGKYPLIRAGIKGYKQHKHNH